ncbi:hypothetical protein PITC_015620 [Penicillium italicum]|uniref:Uncharacterized protein n=1 Tax=Penicillium italicum TaxID=40296 RepID=A0A0A2KBW8_PENIT|nr:hypothetical protein PITC_015620 [Penicillium italicum]
MESVSKPTSSVIGIEKERMRFSIQRPSPFHARSKGEWRHPCMQLIIWGILKNKLRFRSR